MSVSPQGVEQPYPVTAMTVPVDAMSSVASCVCRNWGDYGYRIGVQAWGFDVGVFGVRCSDGSEFFLMADRFGNVFHAEWDGEKWSQGERV